MYSLTKEIFDQQCRKWRETRSLRLQFVKSSLNFSLLLQFFHSVVMMASLIYSEIWDICLSGTCDAKFSVIYSPSYSNVKFEWHKWLEYRILAVSWPIVYLNSLYPKSLQTKSRAISFLLASSFANSCEVIEIGNQFWQLDIKLTRIGVYLQTFCGRFAFHGRDRMNEMALGCFECVMPSKSCAVNLFVVVFVSVSFEVTGFVGKLW